MLASLAADSRCLHGEGVFWSAAEGLLYWTDIHGKRVWTLDPKRDEPRMHEAGARVCCFTTRDDCAWHEVLAGFDHGFAYLDLLTGTADPLAPVEENLPQTRLNDGRTDPQGRFVAGTMDERDGKPVGSVWRLDENLRLTRLIENVSISNSICFSPDGKWMYFTDSPTQTILRYPYGETLGAPEPFAHILDGYPDGSCTDAEGGLWTAIWEGRRVERRGPDGTLTHTVQVPVHKPSCVAFGGAKLDTLYITTSREGESQANLAREPHAGSLFCVKPGIKGWASPPFKG
jgi:L-arabinonolactonase